MQSYTLEQLVRLELLAFRSDWEKAFDYIGLPLADQKLYAMSVTRSGIIEHVQGYWAGQSETEKFDYAIKYLIDLFEL